jgi:hypothetical protein
MESKTRQSNDPTTDVQTKDLMCWRMATSPPCLRVETINEVHLFPYGYFQHARFARLNGKDVVEIQFQDRVVTVRGKALEPLCDALERLVVEKIRLRPEKYTCLAKNEAIIEEIDVSDGTKKISPPIGNSSD